jgi:hypothetical protein
VWWRWLAERRHLGRAAADRADGGRGERRRELVYLDADDPDDRDLLEQQLGRRFYLERRVGVIRWLVRILWIVGLLRLRRRPELGRREPDGRHGNQQRNRHDERGCRLEQRRRRARVSVLPAEPGGVLRA